MELVTGTALTKMNHKEIRGADAYGPNAIGARSVSHNLMR